MKLRHPITLLVAIAMCELAGIIGSIFTIQSIPVWYASLNKPSFTPPSWVFGPVWTILYLLMGVALYLVYEKRLNKHGSNSWKYAFIVQLMLNVFWSIIFFGARSLFGGLITILALWIAIAATIILFLRIRRSAGALMMPYLLWVTCATILNASLFLLNK